MTSGIKTVIYPVKDLVGAKALYGTVLGVGPDMDEAYYVGFTVGEQHIGLDPNGHGNGMEGPIAYYHVDDVNESVRRLLTAGAVQRQAVQDVGGGKLVGSVTDTDGNVIGLIQAP